MAGEKSVEKGQEGADTPLFPGGETALDVPAKDEIDRGMSELPGLFAEGGDRLGELAEVSNARRRGRPAGSANRRNDDVFDYLEARGFKNPILRLMEIVSADWTDIERMKLQIRAAEALLPYMLAKKPQTLQIDKNTLHVFMAGPLSQPGQRLAEKFSLFGNAEQYQGAHAPVGQDAVGREDNAEKDQGVDLVKPAH
jgi:hypothetical protein